MNRTGDLGDGEAIAAKGLTMDTAKASGPGLRRQVAWARRLPTGASSLVFAIVAPIRCPNRSRSGHAAGIAGPRRGRVGATAVPRNSHFRMGGLSGA